jgi:hypothetical protein
LEGTDGSYKFGLVKFIDDTFYRRVPWDFHNLYDMAKNFSKQAAGTWWKHAARKDLKDPRIYECARNQLQSNFITTWKSREEAGALSH